jgi:heterodisulfide reductase subunit B
MDEWMVRSFVLPAEANHLLVQGKLSSQQAGRIFQESSRGYRGLIHYTVTEKMILAVLFIYSIFQLTLRPLTEKLCIYLGCLLTRAINISLAIAFTQCL